MFAKLFNGDFTVPQMAIFIMAVILIILSLVIALNCYVECCCRGANDLQKYEEDDQQFFDKEYYDDICTLLYRHNQMEIKQMEGDWELIRKNENNKEPARFQEKSRTNSEKFLLLKDDLEPFKINHNVKIKGKATEMEKTVNKRRTWIGIEDDGKFEPVQMPNTGVIQGKQTMDNTPDRYTSIKKSGGQETTV